MICVGKNEAFICKGDYHPATLYKGNKKIAGYTITEFNGEGSATLPNCYNDKVYDVVSEAESVTVRGKNILDMSKETVTKGYYLDSSGGATSNSTNLIKISQIDVEPNTTYTLSSNVELYTIWCFNGSTAISKVTAYNTKKRQFTTPENCNYIRVSLDIRNMDTSENTGVGLFKWAMLEKGVGDGIYEPYIAPQTVNSGEEIPTFFGTTVIETEGKISGKYKKREV